MQATVTVIKIAEMVADISRPVLAVDEDALPRPQRSAPMTLYDHLADAWQPFQKSSEIGVKVGWATGELVLRGLRVRMGMHCGVKAAAIR